MSGPDDTIILDIAIPGLTKKDLEVSFDEGMLSVKSINETDISKYTYKGIPDSVNGKWRIGNDLKIDMVTCGDGLLRVLMSKKLSIPESRIIQVQ
jgi:HSP20 family molecular chaperone IbpA